MPQVPAIDMALCNQCGKCEEILGADAVEDAVREFSRGYGADLVLAGGGAKGAAHVGVIEVLDEMRIPIDCIAGTSMGALVGGMHAAGHAGRVVVEGRTVEVEAAVGLKELNWNGSSRE